ncbi:PhnD/SsuA/transferrin family substrate-binding protein [Rhodanobacter lindaniclasticus]
MRASLRVLCGCLVAGVFACGAGVARAADDPAAGATPIRFGILPMGGAAESLEQWRPLLSDLHERLGLPVTTVSVGSYASLSDAIGAQRVDIAFLSGGLAVEAVIHQRMQVFAQFVRSDGARGNVAMLVVRADSPIRWPTCWPGPGAGVMRAASVSVTGYTAPEAYVFAPRGLNSDTFFGRVEVGDRRATCSRWSIARPT